MPNPTVMPQFQANQQVTAVNLLAMEEGTRNLAAGSIAAILGPNGGNLSFNSMDQPLTATVSGMAVTLGGAGGQKVLIQNANGPRLVDGVPIFTQTVSTADATNTRQDLFCARYNNAQVTAGTGNFETIAGSTVSTSTAAIYNSTESLTWQYVVGVPSASPSDPAVPSGFFAMVRVTIPANAGSLSSSNLAILLTTMQAAILSGVAGYVDLTSNQTIAGNKTFSGTTIAGGLLMASTDAIQTVPTIRVGSYNNLIISPAGPGHTLFLGYDDAGLAAINLGPVASWGSITGAGFNSGGSTYGQNASVPNGFVHIGPSTGPGISGGKLPGDLIVERGTAGVLFLGNSGNTYLYCDGTTFVFQGGALAVNGRFTTQGITSSSPILLNSSRATIGADDNVSAQNVSGGSLYGAFTGTPRFAIDAIGNMGLAGGLKLGTLPDYAGVSLLSTGVLQVGTGAGSTLISPNGASIGGPLSCAAISVNGLAGVRSIACGVNAPAPGNGGDIGLARDGAGNTGYIQFGNAGGNPTASLGFDGSNFVLSPPSAKIAISSINIPAQSIQSQSIYYPYQSIPSAAVQIGPGWSIANFSSTGITTASSFPATSGQLYLLYGSTLSSLPGPSSQRYRIIAEITSDTNSGYHSLQGFGGDSSWNVTLTQNDLGSTYQTITLIGGATGGNNPSVSYTMTGIGDGYPPGILKISAYAL